MSNKNYGPEWVEKAMDSVSRKRDAIIKGLRILTVNGEDKKCPRSNDIGIKVWGMIDGLVEYHGFTHHVVDNFKEKG